MHPSAVAEHRQRGSTMACAARMADRCGPPSARFETTECGRARRRQFLKTLRLLIAAAVTAMAGQRHHALGVLAVDRTEFFPCGCDALTCHVGAFGGCGRHGSSSSVSAPVVPKCQNCTRTARRLAQGILTTLERQASATIPILAFPAPASTCSTAAGCARAPGWLRSTSRRRASVPPRAPAPLRPSVGCWCASGHPCRTSR